MHRPALAILAAVLLAACASKPKGDVVLPMNPPTEGPAATATPADPAAPAPAAATPAPAAPAAAPAPRAPRQAPAGRAARAPDPPPAANVDEGPLTVTKARELCWMKYESGKPISNTELDKKVKLVEKCVEDRMNAPTGR